MTIQRTRTPYSSDVRDEGPSFVAPTWRCCPRVPASGATPCATCSTRCATWCGPARGGGRCRTTCLLDHRLSADTALVGRRHLRGDRGGSAPAAPRSQGSRQVAPGSPRQRSWTAARCNPHRRVGRGRATTATIAAKAARSMPRSTRWATCSPWSSHQPTPRTAPRSPR